MHTVIGFECTGCEHCVPACPVDCIDLHPVVTADKELLPSKLNLAQQRFFAREQRLSRLKKKGTSQPISATTPFSKEQLQQEIAAAVARKRNQVRVTSKHE
jgi:electron transport complex protein RnfB